MLFISLLTEKPSVSMIGYITDEVYNDDHSGYSKLACAILRQQQAGLEPNGPLTFRHLLIVVYQRFAYADLLGFTWRCEAKEFPLGDVVRLIDVARTAFRSFFLPSLRLLFDTANISSTYSYSCNKVIAAS